MADPTARTINFYNYVVTAPLGFIGHTCSFITFSSKSLRETSTGLLFLFLTSSDALYQLMFIYDFLVQTLQITTTYNIHVCRFRTFIFGFSNATSAWLLVLIALDRFIRARYLHIQASLCTRKVACYIVCAMCICTAALNCHLLLPEYSYFNRGSNVCGMSRTPVTTYTNFYFNIWPILQSAVFYLLPSCLMIACAIGVYSKLRVQGLVITTATKKEKLQRQMLLLMMTSVIFFSLCTLPYSINRIINLRVGSTSTSALINAILAIFFNMNYCYNFYLRCLTSHLFRQTLLRQIKRFYFWCRRMPMPLDNSVMPLQTLTLKARPLNPVPVE